MSDLKNLSFIRSRKKSRLHKNQYSSSFSGDVNQLLLLHLLKWTSSLLTTFKKERQHIVLILMNVPSLMVKIEFFKSDVVILFVSQDDHILNLLEGVIKTKTYMKKGLNTMSDLKNIIVHKRRNIMFKNNWTWTFCNKK